MKNTIKNKILLSIVAAAAVYVGLALAADYEALLSAVRRFPTPALSLVLGLSAINYLLRYVRWEMYLGRMQISLPRRDRFALFFGGLALSVTPAKAGELLKAEFLRKRSGTSLSTGIPLVMMERLTDFISLIFLWFVSTFHLQHGHLTPLVVALALLLSILALSRPPLIFRVFGLLNRLPLPNRVLSLLQEAYDATFVLLKPGPFLAALLLGIAAWLAECIGSSIVLDGLNASLGLRASTFIYSSSTLFGALTMLPGGLGTTEASMTGLLVFHDIPLSAAATATILIRACTLWFAVLVGGVTGLVFRKSFQ